MFVDSGFFTAGSLPPVVVIGSGPAGLTLAVELVRRGHACLVLEAGQDGYSAESQDFYAGRTVGDRYFELDATRLRQFGGSSNHWTGICRPLEPWDFEARPEIGLPGWPISGEDLAPYDADARRMLEIGDTPSFPLDPDLREVGYGVSPPVNMAEKHRAQIADSPRLHVALGTAVEWIEAEAGSVTALHLRLPSGASARIEPRVCVIACGGIETLRLLLWSNVVSSERVVAEPAALGRYWTDHPQQTAGGARIERPFHRTEPILDRAISVAPTAQALRRYAIPNVVVRLKAPRRLQSAREWVERAVCGTGMLGTGALERAMNESIECGDAVTVTWEQLPDAANRVALSETERDAFGVPRVELHWRRQRNDYRTAKVGFELAARYLVGNGRGTVRAAPHLIELQDNVRDTWMAEHHHMGGARMSVSPNEGVVDSDLRIHGLRNGYVLGSSVFPSGGYANPTLTIVTLAYRLADHLDMRVL